MTVLWCCFFFFFSFFLVLFKSTFGNNICPGADMWHFETKPLWMLRAALCYSAAVWSGSGRWASPIEVSEQHRGGIDTKAGSHKTFNIIQSPLSHARSDNVTFKNNQRMSVQEVRFQETSFFLCLLVGEFLKSRMRSGWGREGEGVVVGEKMGEFDTFYCRPLFELNQTA